MVLCLTNTDNTEINMNVFWLVNFIYQLICYYLMKFLLKEPHLYYADTVLIYLGVCLIVFNYYNIECKENMIYYP
jgi:hypothetical protein